MVRKLATHLSTETILPARQSEDVAADEQAFIDYCPCTRLYLQLLNKETGKTENGPHTHTEKKKQKNDAMDERLYWRVAHRA